MKRPLRKTTSRKMMLIAGMVHVLVAGAVGPVLAQTIQPRRPPHYFQSAYMPPGEVGRAQLGRQPQLASHVQTVELRAPDRVRLSVAMHGNFPEPEPERLLVGLMIGHVYHFKVTNIPLQEGHEVFPTIELINRLYSPDGKEMRFPIPVELTQEELEFALQGLMVTRVIYLEDSHAPDPAKDDGKRQRYFDARAGEDPLYIADTLGKPMAILRMGSRIPDLAAGQWGYPPVMRYAQPEPALPAAPANIEAAIVRESVTHPRLPLPGEPSRKSRFPAVIRTR